ERAVSFFQPAKTVDQRNPDRDVRKEPLEALARQAQRRLPFAFRRQIPHHRTGAQLWPGPDDALADPGLQGAAIAASQRNLAALLAVASAVERIGGRRVLGR